MCEHYHSEVRPADPPVRPGKEFLFSRGEDRNSYKAAGARMRNTLRKRTKWKKENGDERKWG